MQRMLGSADRISEAARGLDERWPVLLTEKDQFPMGSIPELDLEATRMWNRPHPRFWLRVKSDHGD